MTIGELKQEIKDYLHVDATTTVENLTIIDRLVLSALNKARKQAERENDFALAMVHGSLAVSPGSGGSLAVVQTSIGPVSMKSVVTAYLEGSGAPGTLVPLSRRPRKTYAGMVHKSNQLLQAHYPTEWPHRASESLGLELHTFGNSVFLEPAPTTTTTVKLDGYRWLPDYTGDANSDFLTEHGHDFMLWQSVLHVNRRLEIFVQRQEGTLPPPTDARDEAWESLLKWDAFLHEEGREHDLGS